MPNNTLFADEFAKAITAWSPNLAALVGPELAAATAQATEAAGEAQAAATLAQGLVDALPDGIGTGVTPYQVGIEGVGQGDAAKDTEALNLAIDLAISLNTYVTWRGTLHIRPGGTSLGPYYGGDTNPIYTAIPIRSGMKLYGPGELVYSKPDITLFNPTQYGVMPDGTVVTPGTPGSTTYTIDELAYPSTARFSMFGTADALPRGTYENVEFKNFTIRWDDAAGGFPTRRVWKNSSQKQQGTQIVNFLPDYLYGFGHCGVTNMTREGLTLVFSGGPTVSTAARGRGQWAHNADNLCDLNLIHDTITQAAYFAWVYGRTGQNLCYFGLTEAEDNDGPVWDLTLNNLWFKNLRGESQAIDSAGGARWNITNVLCENVNEAVVLYSKRSSWPTYEQRLNALANDPPDDPHRGYPADSSLVQTIRQVSVKGVKATGYASIGGRSLIMVGQNRDSSWTYGNILPPLDITIEDVEATNTNRITVYEGEVSIRNVRLRDTKNITSTLWGAALSLYQSSSTANTSNPSVYPDTDNIATSVLRGVVEDVSVWNSDGGGVWALGPSTVNFSNILVNGYHTGNKSGQGQGFRVSMIGRKAGLITFGGFIDVRGAANAASAQDLRLDALTGAGAICRLDLRGATWNLGSVGATTISISGVSADMKRCVVPLVRAIIPRIDMSGSAPNTFTPIYQPPAGFKAFILGGFISPSANLTADVTNNVAASLFKMNTANPTAGLYVNASVVSINGVARNLGDVVDMGSAFYTAEQTFTENDQLNVRYGRNGSGAIVAPLFVNVVALEYTAFP